MAVFKRIRLGTKMAVLLAVLFIVALVANVAWFTQQQSAQTENELRAQAEVLSKEMAATWEFMVINRDLLEGNSYSANGQYQGLYCAVAGRSIAKLFSLDSDTTIRFVNFSPRNAEDEPDEFESRALDVFKQNAQATEYYGFGERDNKRVFRYLAPMVIKQDCLDCHGGPKGELDVTGNEKEGWEKGDNGGAVSIVIPTALYDENERAGVVRTVLFSVVLMLAALLMVWVALRKLVSRPLARIGGGVTNLRTGKMDTRVAAAGESAEMDDLAHGFNSMAEELEKLYTNLEGEVADRTVQLQAANTVLSAQREQLEEVNERLRNDNQYKSDFLAMMSHELRTPLTSIVAYAEMLNRADYIDTETDSKTRTAIETNSRVLLMMINDILEMSRIDAGRAQMSVEAVDIADVVGMVASVMRPLAANRHIAFSVDVAPDVPIIQADFEKLRHVVENLAGNALKFTNEGGSVSVRAYFDVSVDSLVIEVADTGIGIAKRDQQRIFEKFAQAEVGAATRKYGGTGLGLALAKEYTEMHGGTISVESEPGQGSTFSVNLPVGKAGDNGDEEQQQ